MEHRRRNTLRRACAIVFVLILAHGISNVIPESIGSHPLGTHFGTRFIDEEKVMQSGAMNSKSLIDTMLSFLSKEFQVEEAEQLWGKIEMKTNPNSLILRPRYYDPDTTGSSE